MPKTDEERAKKAAYMRQWTAANRDRVNRDRRRRYAENAQRRAAKLAYQAAYRATVTEETKRERALAMRDKVNAWARAYYAKNSETIKARVHNRRALENRVGGAGYTTAVHIAARWSMWGDKCRYCGSPATCTDHRIPLVRGGAHLPANLVPACGSCNNRKYNYTEREFLARLEFA